MPGFWSISNFLQCVITADCRLQVESFTAEMNVWSYCGLCVTCDSRFSAVDKHASQHPCVTHCIKEVKQMLHESSLQRQ